jgi:Tol biopolymer transport system component
MSNDADQTMLSMKRPSDLGTPPPQPPPPSNNKSLYMVIGMLGVLIALLLVGLVYLFLSGGDEPPDNLASVPDGTPTVVVTEKEDTKVVEEVDTPTPMPTAVGDPEISEILFSLKSMEDSKPTDQATSFKAGITQLHAIFDYDNMLREYNWERVWYVNDKELLRKSESWAGDVSGTYDYLLDSGGSDLPTGKWLLELYVEDELLATGKFEIKEVKAPIPTSTPKPKIEAETKTNPKPKTEAEAETGAEAEAKTEETETKTPTAKPVANSGGGGGGGTYQLAFSRFDGADHYVYVADTNGNNQTFIISRAAGPSWSPDKKQLFFFGEQGINQQMRENRVDCDFGTISGGIVGIDLQTPYGDICRAKYGVWLCERHNNDQTIVCLENNIRVFQNLDWKDGSARWATVNTNGRLIGFDGTPSGGRRLYFLDIIDPNLPRFELIGENGSWSPDGLRMVYRSGRDNKAGIWISNRDDTGHLLITNEGSDDFPAWSPNGQTIAFSRNVGGNIDIYTMNIDGSNIQRLTDAPNQDVLPTYTPSGDIIFRSARTGSWSIWKMSGNGDNQQQIISNADPGPDWAKGRMDVR